MGVDLTTIGNHNVKFKHRRFENVAKEICDRLNAVSFPNAEYLRLRRLYEANHSNEGVRVIRKINTLKEWIVTSKQEDFKCKGKSIMVSGPFGLRIWVYQGMIVYSNPALRYWQWYNNEPWDGYEEMINEWRKYFYTVQRAMGGNRVVYTGDSSGYQFDMFFNPVISYDEFEQLIYKDYTRMPTIADVSRDIDRYFYIDYFEDIDWDMHHPLDEYLDEPDDKDCINYNLDEWNTVEKLFDMDFCREREFYKKNDNQLIYHYIMQSSGILFKYTGVAGEIGNLEVSLDEHATFTFDEWEKQFENDGYNREPLEDYIFYFRSHRYKEAWDTALDVLYKILYWYGLGYGSWWTSAERVVEDRVSVVDEQKMLYLVKLIREIFKVEQPMEIYRYDENYKRILILKFAKNEPFTETNMVESADKKLLEHIYTLKEHFTLY